MPVYLDHAATTPLEPRALQAMLPHFKESFGNPSSIHRWGQRAEVAKESARTLMAEAIGCAPGELIFTGGGSESDNLAIAGVALARRELTGADRILTTPVEHEAVHKTALRLSEHHGFTLELLPVDEHGMVAPGDLERMADAETAVVSIIYGNNEIGTINPIAELSAICRSLGVPFHTDAVQAASQLPIDVDALGIDLLSLGAHKFYGPKGVGALYVRAGTPLRPLLWGGEQEMGLRPGTENVPLIAGMAEAFRITVEELVSHREAYLQLRDQLIAGVIECLPEVRLTGHPESRLPNHASFALRGVDGNALLAALDLEGFACSSGSACKTGDPEPSRVLTAIGLDAEWALGSLRITLGRSTQDHEIKSFLKLLPQIVERLRKPSPLLQ